MNEGLANFVVTNFTSLLKEIGVVKEKYELEGSLQNNYVMPYFPFPGVISGGLSVANRVMRDNLQFGREC